MYTCYANKGKISKENVKEIKVFANVTIIGNENVVTKDIMAKAVKRTKRGIFQYRF